MSSKTAPTSSPNEPAIAHKGTTRVGIVIPALNEADGIGKVLDDIPPALADAIVVVDNGSTDRTAAAAAEHGATVLTEPERGYGAACQTGIAYLADCDIIAFLDADYSDHPDELGRILDPLFTGKADLVLGSRVAGRRERGALPLHALFGNILFALLLRLCFGARCTDLGPFRAIRRDALERLGMTDRNYGWTLEMQIKAARKNLRVVEIPVHYRKRIGRSKVSGSVTGSIKATTKMFYTLCKYALARP